MRQSTAAHGEQNKLGASNLPQLTSHSSYTAHSQNSGPQVHTKRSLQSSAQPNQKSRASNNQGGSNLYKNNESDQASFNVNKVQKDQKDTFEPQMYLKLKQNVIISQELIRKFGSKDQNTAISINLNQLYDKAVQNEIEKIDIVMFGGANQGKKTLLLGCKLEVNKYKSKPHSTGKKSYSRNGGILELFLIDQIQKYKQEEVLISFIQQQNQDTQKFIDKFSLDNQEVAIIGQNIYGQYQLRLKSKDGIVDLIKFMKNQSFCNSNHLIVIQNSKVTVKFIILTSVTQIKHSSSTSYSNSLINIAKRLSNNESLLNSIVCLDKNTKSKEEVSKVFQFVKNFDDIKQIQSSSQTQSQKNSLQSIIQNLPSSILKPKIINQLQQQVTKIERPNQQTTKSVKSSQKQSFQFSQTESSTNKDKPQTLSHNQKQTILASQTHAEMYTCKNLQQKRMTTINEQPKEDQNENTTIQSQTDQSLLSESDNDRISITHIIRGQMNRAASSQSQPSNTSTKSLEVQILLKTQEEYQISEQIHEYDNQIKQLKADLHKQQKRSTQKNQKQLIDGIKNQIKQSEEGLKSCSDRLLKLKYEKEQLNKKINQEQQQSFPQSQSKDHQRQNLLDFEDSEKDRKLKEMEEIIKDMSKKLQEKDQIIAETIKQTNISETFKTLNQRKLLLSSIEVKNNQFTEKLSSNPNIKACDVSAFSPTLSRRQLDIKKNQAALSRQKSGASLCSQIQQQTLTESSSQAILSTLEEKKDLKALPDKKKNNSTANLFKWSKPTVNIKIATDESHNGSVSSGNNSIRNNQPSISSQVLQQTTISNKISIQNKMSMVSSLTSSNKAHVSRHQSYQELNTEQSQDSINLRLQKAGKKTNVPKKKHQLEIDYEKENKKQLKADYQNDEFDEGVQNIKKSIVPIRCINNLIVQEHNKRPTSTTSSAYPVNTERSVGTISSPSSVEANKRIRTKLTTKVNDKNLKNEISIFKETSNSHLYQKNRQLLQSSLKCDDKIVVDLTDKKLIQNQNDSKDEFIMVKVSKQDPILTNDDMTNSSYCNEDIQNTPPKIKQKMYQLASKNKFQNQAQKPKATIDLTTKSHFVFNQEKGEHMVIQSQEVDLLDERHELPRNSSNTRENSITIVQRKERLDTFLRKSFELMTTLRTSADQIAQIKPINRAAIRLQSQERSGILSTKNACYETQNVNNMQGSFNSQIGQSLDNRKTILFGYSKSPTQQKQTFPNLQNITNNDSILEQSKTIDGRQNNTQLNFNSLVEKSINCLKNYNTSAQKQNQTNLREQIIAKCLRTGSNSQMNDSQNFTSTQLRWMNRTLLNKCKSNESLQSIPQNQINHAQIERPRSITINHHQSPANFLRQSKDNIINRIDERNIPKWGELANIIKQNFSPTHSQQISQSNGQSFQNVMAFDEKVSMNPQKQYLVRHNKIDLSQSVNNQVTGIPTFSRPPTNPLNIRKRKINEHPLEDHQNQSITNNNFNNNDLNQLTSTNLQIVRGRSESHYIPGIQNHKESFNRTPREQLYEYSLLNSPNHLLNLKLQPEQLNSTYYHRRLQQQQSHQNLNNLNDNSLSNLYGAQTTTMGGCNSSLGKIQLNINTKSGGTAQNNFSSSADFSKGFFTALVSPYNMAAEPIGNREKARPEVTELIERQRSRINSQSRKNTNPIGTDSNYISNV